MAYASCLASGDGAYCASDSDPSGDNVFGSNTSFGAAVAPAR
jgi:hypothetical protein